MKLLKNYSEKRKQKKLIYKIKTKREINLIISEIEDLYKRTNNLHILKDNGIMMKKILVDYGFRVKFENDMYGYNALTLREDAITYTLRSICYFSEGKYYPLFEESKPYSTSDKLYFYCVIHLILFNIFVIIETLLD
jgi:hypothetical protein